MLRKNFSICLSVSVLSASLLLSACQQQDDDHDTDQSVSTQAHAASQPAQAEAFDLVARIENVRVNLPACSGNNCPDFQIQRLKSNNAMVNQQVDAAMIEILQDQLDLTTINPAASEIFASEPQATDFDSQVQQYAQAFLAVDQQLKKMNANPQISFHLQAKVLRKQAHWVTIQLNSDSFLGGAHGAATQQYLTFDLKKQQQLHLSDIVLPDRKAALLKRVHQQFADWVVEQKLANNVEEYEEAWPFKLSTNFYLSGQGLILQYAEYEIGPYVVGMPSFTIPYAQLKGILKPEYLPKTQATTSQSASTVQGTH